MSEVTITMSPSVGAIAAALAKAQLVMRPALKDASNPAFKSGGQASKYASLAAYIEELRPLHEHGIAVLQPPELHGPDGVCVSTLLIHSSSEWIRGMLYMPASKRDPQGFGSALTYARRYCLASTLGLAAEDDDGNTASRSREQERAPEQVPAPSAEENACASLFLHAQTTDDIAAAEARAQKAIAAKLVVNGGRERLLKLRREAMDRVSR